MARPIHNHSLICKNKQCSPTKDHPPCNSPDLVFASSLPTLLSTVVYPAPDIRNTTVETYSNVDITTYDNNGAYGACGVPLYDTDMIAALAQHAWGQSTYDSMTGQATNAWCGQTIEIEHNGNSIQATIMDLCPACAGNDIDLSLAAWTALTGLIEKTRLKGSWAKVTSVPLIRTPELNTAP